MMNFAAVQNDFSGKESPPGAIIFLLSWNKGDTFQSTGFKCAIEPICSKDNS